MLVFKNNADIIVFPEDGLTSVYLPERKEMDPWTTLIPTTSDNCTPCNNECAINVSDTLKSISCAAKANEIYVVINIAEKVPCESAECPNDKVVYYNTNVVFDRTGKVIAKYRKTNLFVEPQFNVTSVPEVITFDTDFGVTFGILICFDILFKEPTLTLTRTLGIRNIVYSAAWFSEAPFITERGTGFTHRSDWLKVTKGICFLSSNVLDAEIKFPIEVSYWFLRARTVGIRHQRIK